MVKRYPGPRCRVYVAIDAPDVVGLMLENVQGHAIIPTR